MPTVCWRCSECWMQSRKHNIKFSHWKRAAVVVAQVGDLLALHAESTSRDFKSLIFGTWTADDHWYQKQTNKEKSSRWLLKCYSFLLIKLIIRQLAESFILRASLPSCVILLNSTQLCTVTSGPTLKNRDSKTLSHFSKITWLVIFRAGSQ